MSKTLVKCFPGEGGGGVVLEGMWRNTAFQMQVAQCAGGICENKFTHHSVRYTVNFSFPIYSAWYWEVNAGTLLFGDSD
jgi:hypothetical protein